MTAKIVENNLLTLLQDYADFNNRAIERQNIPEAIDFCKQVSKNHPCIYHVYDNAVSSQLYQKSVNYRTDGKRIVQSNGVSREADGRESSKLLPSCPALTFTKQEWLELVKDPVEVAVTPNGRADDLHHIETNESDQHEPIFLQPANSQMSLSSLFSKLSTQTSISGRHSTVQETEQKTTSDSAVFYLQSQNSNLTTHSSLSPILSFIPTNLPFAQPTLGEPEAINIWIGDSRSVTSLHRDPYENLYLVLKGSKTFTLYPPVDEVVLPTKLVRTGRWEYDEQSGTFSTVLDEADDETEEPPKIPWITISPLTAREEIEALYPLYKHASPREVTVNEGEILYLPSGWFHHVRQECGVWEDGTTAPCIAVNYWYDMDYDGERYVTRELQRRLVEIMKMQEGEGNL